ncbi:MAG: hypothetical protein CO119_09320 [Flavobacteriales bacterium CG_4_9_14_3_um_filter_40_17]|nr:MAG: hypothetical protein CO119_09320 [Flavobacteriales bacterium CG_4_9_14_3_um_filter_40_17]
MKLALIFFILLQVHFCFSQIKVIDYEQPELIGEIAPMGETHISCKKSGESYIFTYQDVKFEHIKAYKSFSFEDKEGSFDALYNIIMTGFEKIPDKDIMIEIPEGILFIKFIKTLGVTNVRFQHVYANGEVSGFTIWLTRKKINKLFGKK